MLSQLLEQSDSLAAWVALAPCSMQQPFLVVLAAAALASSQPPQSPFVAVAAGAAFSDSQADSQSLVVAAGAAAFSEQHWPSAELAAGAAPGWVSVLAQAPIRRAARAKPGSRVFMMFGWIVRVGGSGTPRSEVPSAAGGDSPEADVCEPRSRPDSRRAEPPWGPAERAVPRTEMLPGGPCEAGGGAVRPILARLAQGSRALETGPRRSPWPSDPAPESLPHHDAAPRRVPPRSRARHPGARRPRIGVC